MRSASPSDPSNSQLSSLQVLPSSYDVDSQETHINTQISAEEADADSNPIYDLARAMFPSATEPYNDYDTFLKEATQNLSKLRAEKGHTEASKLSSKHWDFYTSQLPSQTASAPAAINDEPEEDIVPPTVFASQPTGDEPRKKKKDRDKDKKKKKKKLTPGFM
ncbi:hypothetical protein BDB00DRAFT_836309 [Zychaea mexicana]|uniref:uncharacterized protein n=1 Tax=Zychaea mexicana TaxID=64656 RepID=UPI0022FDE7B1|nr:uncharacterized protein BDB00DRAFT_836309 [Zychaea mexicana]KAI9490840.1 hypothetical protein BDB00DRAFT_836309 [Zychaea mexicana]